MIVIFNRDGKRVRVSVSCNANPAHGIEMSGTGWDEDGTPRDFRGTVTYVELSIKTTGYEYIVALDDA